MFELPERTITIVIPDGDFKGAEIIASRDIPLALVLDIDDASELGGRKGMVKAVTTFADNVLRSWNLSRDGVAIPATAEGMLRLPPDLVVAILQTWGESLKGTPAPLDELSASGKPSEG